MSTIDMNKALAALFNRLHDNKIKYFLLTDFECDLNSSDLDLFVHSHCRYHFEDTLIKLGWYKRKEPTHHYNHNFYYSPDSDIYLDVKYALSFANGHNECFTYKYTDQALGKAIKNAKDVYRPAGIDAILLYAAHLAYKERGKLEKKHEVYLLNYLELYRRELADGELQVADKIAAWQESAFYSDLSSLKQIVEPCFSYEQKQMVRKRKRLNYGYGINILFLGTDGAGKTTLIEAVNNKLNLKTKKLYLGMGESGWSSGIIKKMYKYKFKTRVIDRLYKLFKLFVMLPSEFLLRIIPVKVRAKYSVVLIDRFPGFVFLDDTSVRKRVYQAVLPKPDLVFFLYADPEELVKRKPAEINLERSRADIIKFQEVAKVISDNKYIGIDTSRLSITEARDFIISEIYKHSKIYQNLVTSNFN
jgi:thymidylate kinase